MSHTTYHISIDSKYKDNRQFWFQGGKLTTVLDRTKSFQSWKDFRTKTKLESFLRMLDGVYSNTVVHVWECQRSDADKYPKGICYEIPMGDDWKEYKNDWA
jgi:hypothetical protein